MEGDAKAYHEKSLARTYAAFFQGKVIAYVALVCGESVLESGDAKIVNDEDVDYRHLHYPAVKIARLAVDRRYRGRDLGSSLVDLSLGIAKDIIAQHVGCRFVVVDSKKSAVEFYLKSGFTLLDTETNRGRSEQVLFIDLQKTPLA